ncbi:MAG: hypothetical protein ACTHYC_01970 [Sphingobacterium sp.]
MLKMLFSKERIMKKTITFLFLLSLLGTWSCTKERLVIQDRELQFDENSPEYQVYQAERAMQYIRTFRFEKLGDVLSKINDEGVKENLQDSLRKYRHIAETEALYYAAKDIDTLYFRPDVVVYDPSYREGARLGGHFTLPSTTLVNSRGIIHGFKNFPNTTEFHFYNNRATGLKGLEDLPEMKIFRWLINPSDIVKSFPDEEFEYVPLQADLSGNSHLEEIAVGGIELGRIIFPDHQLESFSNGGIYSAGGNKFPTGSLNGLWAKNISIGGEADQDFRLVNVRADQLIFRPLVKSFDIAETEIKDLNIAGVEKLILNDGLHKLTLSNAQNLKERPNFSASLRDLSIHNFPFAPDFPVGLKKLSYGYVNSYPFDPDFSDLHQLDTLIINYSTDNSYTGVPNYLEFKTSTLKLPSALKHIEINTAGNYTINLEGIQLPPSLESIRFSATLKEETTLDLSNLLNLKEVTFNTKRFGGILKLPPTVEKINFSASELNTSQLDLSQLTNLKSLSLRSSAQDNPLTLILPPNLSESVFMGWSTNVKPVNLQTGSTIINKPAWFDQYVSYYE